MKVRRIDYSPDEMIAGVAGQLEPVEFGVYWMICTLIYSRSGPIPDDPQWISRIFRKTNPRTIRAAVDRLVATGKVTRIDTEKGGELMVNRCRNELERATTRARNWAENGAKGGRPSKENKDLTKPSGFVEENLSSNHQPSTINHQPSDSSLRSESYGAPKAPTDKRRASKRCPNDFEVTDDMKAWAAENCPNVDLARQTAAFRDHEFKTAKRDWPAAWRNWMRRAQDEYRPGPARQESRPSIATDFSTKRYEGTPDDELPAWAKEVMSHG